MSTHDQDADNLNDTHNLYDADHLNDKARQEVLALEASIYDNPSSRANVGHLLAPEFWEVSPSGEKVTGEMVLERMATNPMIVDEYPVNDTRVDVYGDVAISTGRTVLRGRVPQEDGTEKHVERINRFAHVWVRRDGRWQTVFAQNSDAV